MKIMAPNRWGVGQRVEYVAGGMASIVMARFTSDAGRHLYDVMNVDDRRPGRSSRQRCDLRNLFELAAAPAKTRTRSATGYLGCTTPRAPPAPSATPPLAAHFLTRRFAG